MTPACLILVGVIVAVPAAVYALLEQLGAQPSERASLICLALALGGAVLMGVGGLLL